MAEMIAPKRTKRRRLKHDDVISITKWLETNQAIIHKRNMSFTDIKHIIEKTFGIQAQEQSIERIANRIGAITNTRKPHSSEDILIVAQAVSNLYKELGAIAPQSLAALLNKNGVSFSGTLDNIA